MISLLLYVLIFVFFYLIKARLYLNLLDPLQLLALSEMIMFVNIYSLPTISPSQKLYLYSIMFVYSFFWLTFSVFVKVRYFSALKKCTNYLEHVSWNSIQVLQYLLLIIAILIFVIGQVFSLTGDARLSLTKIFRPVEAFWTIGFYIYLVAIVISKKRVKRFSYFVLMIILSIFISTFGKGYILNIILPISLIFWHKGWPVRIKHLVLTSILVVLGISFGLIFAHGAVTSSIYSIVLHRFVNDSDIYILGMSEHVISSLHLSNFFTYVFGPFFKILGLGYYVDHNIGSQVGSLIAGRQVLTGPNAQLGYLGMVYFRESYLHATISCFLIIGFWFLVKYGIVVFVSKTFQMSIRHIFILFFALVYPQSVLKDPTFTTSFLIVTITSLFIYVIFKSCFRYMNLPRRV